jgi:DNA-binding beta-propeller fold protein YncE
MRSCWEDLCRYVALVCICLAPLDTLLAAEPSSPGASPASVDAVQRRLYVAVPGIRNYLEFGGHGLLVFDLDHEARFLKRIPLGGLDASGQPINVKGICASAANQRLYVSTLVSLQCVDLAAEAVLWERPYPGGCDRMAIDPAGERIYLPSLEQEHWHVVDAKTGDILQRIDGIPGAHNTIASLDGSEVYLAGRLTNRLRVYSTTEQQVVREVGPFSHNIRPFTVTANRQRVYVCIDDCLGFEIGDLQTGQRLARVEVTTVTRGPVKRHSCPSHGIGLTPDEREVWVVDAFNESVHVFDLLSSPPVHRASIKLREQPGWVTFTLDGQLALLSTGELIDVATRQIRHVLTDETGRQVHSEKMVEVHWTAAGTSPTRVVRVGDQFGLGRQVTADVGR